MFVNGYSIALICSCIASLFLCGTAVRSAIRILLHWDQESDTARQIELESETWLAAVLVEFGLILQLFSIILLVLAADSFSEILVGAMCAAGAFSANNFGPYSLVVKLIGLFLYGFWLVIHRIDISSEHLPLIRFKFAYLLVLMPLLALDLWLVIQYITFLEPDIITSCCGVLFGEQTGGGFTLMKPVNFQLIVLLYSAVAAILFVISMVTIVVTVAGSTEKLTLLRRVSGGVLGLFWLIFFAFSLVVITTVVSPYIYAMPSHRCPFDILQSEYNYIGLPIYLSLFVLSFCGSSAGFISLFSGYSGVQQSVGHFRRKSHLVCLVLLPVYFVLIAFYPALYLFFGGEY